MKNLWILVLCLFAATAAQAQNLAKKLKKAQAIEVTYQSVYKGKVRPGSNMVMTVSGDQVKLQPQDGESKGFAKETSYID